MAVGGVSDVDKGGGGTPSNRSDRVGQGGDRDPAERRGPDPARQKLEADIKAKIDAGFTDDEILASLIGSGLGTDELSKMIAGQRGSTSAAARGARIATSSRTGTTQSILSGTSSGPATVQRTILGGGI